MHQIYCIMQKPNTKLELDIQPLPEGQYEATSCTLEGYVAQNVSILEAIEQAIATASNQVPS